MRLKWTLRALYRIFEGFMLFICSYAFCVFALPQITVNSGFTQCARDGVAIYIRTNGVHTDIAVPFRNDVVDWGTFVKPSCTKSGDTAIAYASFGWGDKGFYLQTKTWADLKFSVAFKAAFFLSSTAMHVTFFRRMNENNNCIRICITREQYRTMVEYIRKSFAAGSNGLPQQISNASYFDNDAFYEANGTYGFSYTCNTWANNALMNAGIKCCLWTPFDKGIFSNYRKQK